MRAARRAKGILPRRVPVISTDEVKECLDCEGIKLLSEFSNNPKGRRGKSTYCRSCAAVRTQMSYMSIGV